MLTVRASTPANGDMTASEHTKVASFHLAIIKYSFGLRLISAFPFVKRRTKPESNRSQ
jgi:hypothetical protein